MKKQKISYKESGVNYEAMDPIKVLAQLRAKATAANFNRFGAKEIADSRGESAYVWEEKDEYRAFVIEGLGTKNLVADETRKFTGKTHYDTIAQDTVAMIVNDLIVVGADPQVVNAYFAIGSGDWFSDEERAIDLVEGWAKACDLAGAVWGGGETPTLKDIVDPGTIDLAGSAIGVIKPKKHLTLGEKLDAGDAIILIESSGIHANGLTLARTIASQLPKGYATLLPDGTSYGESILAPTHIYAQLIRDTFDAGVEIHYMTNITGHGWRKLMRANKIFTYVMHTVPNPQPIFPFIQKNSGNDDQEMYGNFNMGAGFALFINKRDVKKTIDAATKNSLKAWHAGTVEKGEKQVIIEPLKLTYKGDTLKVKA
ncbi:MAG TPA: AIR synthase related protein [Candidatus Acidoferrales bacterium]|nr:AIR synthase related protein [Candidatus Acidoferrales bacterium]